MKILVNNEKSLLEKIKDETKSNKTIICGDSAIDIWTNNEKKKFKLDILTTKENINSFIKNLNSIKEVVTIEKYSSDKKRTILYVEGLITNGFKWTVNLKITLNTSLTKKQIKQMKKDNLIVDFINKGFVLSPELLVVNSFKKALELTPPIKHLDNNGSVNKINFKNNLVKEVLNIANLMFSNDLDKNKLNKALYFSEEIDSKSLNLNKLKNLTWLVKYNCQFLSKYFEEMNKWEVDTYLPINTEHLFLRKLKNTLDNVNEIDKKEKEIKR